MDLSFLTRWRGPRCRVSEAERFYLSPAGQRGPRLLSAADRARMDLSSWAHFRITRNRKPFRHCRLFGCSRARFSFLVLLPRSPPCGHSLPLPRPVRCSSLCVPLSGFVDFLYRPVDLSDCIVSMLLSPSQRVLFFLTVVICGTCWCHSGEVPASSCALRFQVSFAVVSALCLAVVRGRGAVAYAFRYSYCASLVCVRALSMQTYLHWRGLPLCLLSSLAVLFFPFFFQSFLSLFL